MDPLESVKPWKDTTYFLMLGAAQRGHEVYAMAQTGLSLRQDALFGWCRPVQVFDNHDRPFESGPLNEIDLREVDVVWERTDPPVNRRYLYTSMFLDFLPASVTVINRPSAIRDRNEKLSALKFPDITPETLVTSNPSEILEFVKKHDRVTLKPIDGHGGKGVQFCDARTRDLGQLLAAVTGDGTRWTIAQEYLPLARDGDKRVLLLEGEPLGAVLRLHAEGQELNNLDQGGTAEPTELTESDLAICRQVGPALRGAGIVFAGIDIIGGRLMEVNVTSPTGLQEASRFSRQPLHHKIIERLELGEAA